MRVDPKRNKPFECDECGKKVRTRSNYRKFIVVRFEDGQKFRNKFCSMHCLEKWNLVSGKEPMPQETLEEGIKLETYDRDEEREEEEPYAAAVTEPTKKASKAAYIETPEQPDYYSARKEEALVQSFDPNKDTSDDTLDPDAVRFGYIYDKGGTGQKKVRTVPRTYLEKMRDKLKSWRILYDRD